MEARSVTVNRPQGKGRVRSYKVINLPQIYLLIRVCYLRSFIIQETNFFVLFWIDMTISDVKR